MLIRHLKLGLSKVLSLGILVRVPTFLLILLLGTIGTGVKPAHAFLEIRGTYGMNVVKPTDIESGATSYFPVLTDIRGLGADLIVSLPAFPIGFGVRYEKLDSSKSATVGGYTSSLTAELSRVALLVNFRIIDTGIYLGALGTYGLSHTTGLSIETDLPLSSNYPNLKASSVSTMTVGVEGGVHIMSLVLGGDLGYMIGKANTFMDNGTIIQTADGSNLDVDLGGLFAKVHVGYMF